MIEEVEPSILASTTSTDLCGLTQLILAELPLLTVPECHRLLVEWNAAQTDYPKDKCIHQLFEEQVAKTLNAIALVFKMSN